MGLRNLWQRVRESASAAFGAVFTRMGSVSGSLDVPGLDRPAESLLWIYLGMMARAEAVSQVPLRVSRGDGEILEDGDLVELLDQPNAWMDKVQYIALIESYLALHNECEIVIVRGASGQPLELVPLSPMFMEPVTGVHVPTGLRIGMGWRYRDPNTAETHVFAREDVIPIVMYSPYNQTRSIWPTTPGKRAMQVDVMAQEQNLAIFKNGGMPDIVFETEQRWDKEQADEFMERWMDRYGGAANAHKPGMLYGGLSAKPLGLSPEDLQFFEGRRMSRQEQIACIRVKPAMVGLMEGETGLSQGSSTAEQIAAWWSDTGLFELARIAAAHQRYLVDKHAWGTATVLRSLGYGQRIAYQHQRERMRAAGAGPMSDRSGGLVLWFDEHEIEALMMHRLQKIDILVKVLEKGWEPDAAGEYLGLRLPPHPTNIPTLPFSIQPATDLASRRPAEIQPVRERGAAPAEIGARLDDLDRALSALADWPEAVEREAPRMPARYASIARAFEAYVTPREKAAARKWSQFFFQQQKRVRDRFDELVARVAEREERSDLTDGDLGPDKILLAVFPLADEGEQLVARLTPLWTRHMMDGVAFFGEHESPGGSVADMTIDDPRVMAALEQRKIQGLKVNDTTENDLRELIRKAFEEGDTTTQLGDRVDAYYAKHIGEGSARPMTAARTQVAGIVNDGRLLAAQEVGGLAKGWLHGGSEVPRPGHLAAQERYLHKPIPVDQMFELPGDDGTVYRAASPGAASLPVKEAANCTCTMVFFPEEEGGE